MKDASGIEVHPCFFEQSAFKTLYTNKDHFFTGVSLKQKVILEALSKHPGEIIVFSDVDIVVNPKGLAEYLQNFQTNDITFLSEFDQICAGFCMMRNTPYVKTFFQTIYDRIETEGGLDQAYTIEEATRYPGPIGFFTFPEVLNVNAITLDALKNFKVIQLTVGANQSEETVLNEKIFSLQHLLAVISVNQ